MLVEQFLPEMFQELESLLQDPKKACADIGFCPRMGEPRKMTPPHVETSIHPAYAFFEAAKTIQTPTGSVLMSCLECKVAVEESINGLIADRVGSHKNYKVSLKPKSWKAELWETPLASV
ncbi:surfactant protein B [Oesophagostomum dentatum]|uniref:Surfactant protein B n=1 Tax=Oesophagostomum dentatum TaxID=61180 RepID=A0A0B1RVX1_OESDE|nr:surfactant protein B [Oesophagostomum dentatum]